MMTLCLCFPLPLFLSPLLKSFIMSTFSCTRGAHCHVFFVCVNVFACVHVCDTRLIECADEELSLTLLAIKKKDPYRKVLIDDIKRDFNYLFLGSHLESFIALQEPKAGFTCITHNLERSRVLTSCNDAVFRRVHNQHLCPNTQRLLTTTLEDLQNLFSNDNQALFDFIFNSLPATSIDGYSNLVISVTESARGASMRGCDAELIFAHCKRAVSSIPVRTSRQQRLEQTRTPTKRRRFLS